MFNMGQSLVALSPDSRSCLVARFLSHPVTIHFRPSHLPNLSLTPGRDLARIPQWRLARPTTQGASRRPSSARLEYRRDETARDLPGRPSEEVKQRSRPR